MGYLDIMLPVFILLSLFFIPSFFVFKRIFTKKEPGKKLENVVMSFAFMLIFPVVVMFIAHLTTVNIIMPIANASNPIEFNKKDWLTDSGCRINMYSDIKIKFIGKKRAEIISVFGSNFENGPDYICKNSFNYCISHPDDGYFGIDHYAMVFCFDDDDKLVDVTVSQI